MTALTAPRAFPFGPTISSTFSPELPQLLSAPAWPGLPPNSPPPYCASPMAISSPFDMPALSISFDALPTRGRAPSRSNTSTSSTSSTSSRRFRVSPHPNILRQRRRVAGQFVVGLDSGSEDDSERPFFDFEP
ncbi:hypothetical protein SEUCBS140593_003479 [Sporothrix eucalyptigena]|uniref:Uncharacterized protein n=1 Tax=Sporothrix eucalyptigena TaxID=1812306 RepID=A0ABP0BF80_9PEZI